MPYVWLGILVLAVVVESMTCDLIAVWFMPAALIAAILAFCNVPFFVQLLCFILVGLALAIATRPLCRRLISNRGEKTNANALVGQVALVTEEIRNIDGVGEVKVGGLCWSARSKDPALVIAQGEQAEILEIEGVKLIVRPIPTEQNKSI